MVCQPCPQIKQIKQIKRYFELQLKEVTIESLRIKRLKILTSVIAVHNFAE